MPTKESIAIAAVLLATLLTATGGYFVSSQSAPNFMSALFSQPNEGRNTEDTKTIPSGAPQPQNTSNGGVPNTTDTLNAAGNQILGGWKLYNKTNQWFGFTTEYPADWSVKEFGSGEIGSGVYFLPPGETSDQKSISLMIINYKKTPPPPVWYTYTTLRVVRVGNQEVLVQKRTPDSNQYIAHITKGDYTMELRFSIGTLAVYGSVFDHILSSFVWTK